MWQQWQHNKVIEQHHHLDLLSPPHQINAAPTQHNTRSKGDGRRRVYL